MDQTTRSTASVGTRFFDEPFDREATGSPECARAFGASEATELGPDTVLQLAPGIRTRWNAAGHVLVDSPVGTIIDIGPGGFAILSLFSRPLTLGNAIARLECEHASSTDFAPTMSVINMLIEESGR